MHSQLPRVPTNKNRLPEQLLNNPKKLSKELQYNLWIFEDIKSKLRCSGFAVQPEYPNKNIIPPVNEYLISFTDYPIFHPQTTSTIINLLSLSIDEGNRESDVDIDKSRIPTNAPPLYDVLLSSFEVKSHTVDRAGIAECFSNMIGVGTRIATDIMQGENLVETINVYGIVISMVDPLS